MGKIGGRQTISVGNSDGSITCKHGNIVHEIAHSLGFFHEHSRPDRDNYVSILWDNVESGEYTIRKRYLSFLLLVFKYNKRQLYFTFEYHTS